MQFSSVATVDKTPSGSAARCVAYGFAAPVSPLKYNPLAVDSVQRLTNYCLPKGALVDLVTGRPDWWLQPRYRQVDRMMVASQYFELQQANGGDAYTKIGCTWNGRHRLVGFDIDFAENADHDGRGCNHPEHDGGNAIRALKALYEEATGGDLIEMHNPASHGIWLLGVVPFGIKGLSLAHEVLRKLEEEGHYIGKGRLEIPSGNARLPLAGYVLTGHEDKSWIEQVDQLADWIDQQIDLVELCIRLPEAVTQLELPTGFERTCFDRGGVYLGNLHWDQRYGSNGFIGVAARRMVAAGHGEESAPLMATLIAANLSWQNSASEHSQRCLSDWSYRWLKSAIKKAGRLVKGSTKPNNQQKHQSWCERVKAGLKEAVRQELRSITSVIDHLMSSQGLSKRLLWERREVISKGMEVEAEIWDAERESAGEQGDLGYNESVTTTQLKPGGGSTGALGCSGFRDAFASSGLLAEAKPKAKKKKGRALIDHLPGLDLIFGRKKVDFGSEKRLQSKTNLRASAPKAPASPKSSEHRKALDFESSASTSSTERESVDLSIEATERVGFEPTMPKRSDLGVMNPTGYQRSDLRVMSPTSYQSAAPLEPEANAPNGFAVETPSEQSQAPLVQSQMPHQGLETGTSPLPRECSGAKPSSEIEKPVSNMGNPAFEVGRVSGRVSFGQSMDCVDFDTRSSAVWSVSEPWAQEQEPQGRQVLTPEQRRDRERAELEAWLAG